MTQREQINHFKECIWNVIFRFEEEFDLELETLSKVLEIVSKQYSSELEDFNISFIDISCDDDEQEGHGLGPQDDIGDS